MCRSCLDIVFFKILYIWGTTEEIQTLTEYLLILGSTANFMKCNNGIVVM